MKINILLILCGIYGLAGICQILFGQETELYVRTGHSYEVTSLKMSTDGRLLISLGSNEIKIWDLSTKKELRTIKTTFSGIAGSVNEIAISPNGLEIASGNTDGTIVFWDLTSGNKKRQIKEASSVKSIAFSSDGSLLASGCNNKTIGLWNTKTGQKLWTFEGHSEDILSIAFSPNSKLLASGSRDRTIKLWNLETRKVLMTFQGHKEFITHLIFSSDSKKIISASYDYSVRVWDIETAKETLVLNHSFWVDSVAISPDGTKLITAGYYFLKVWDLISGKELRNLTLNEREAILTVVNSANENEIISGSSYGKIKIWNFTTGEEIYSFQSSRGKTEAISLSSNHRFLATGDESGNVKLWNLVEGEAVKILKGHTSQIKRILFSPNGQILATRDSGNIILWDVKTGRKEQSLKIMGSVFDTIAFSFDSEYFSFVENTNEIRTLRVKTSEEFIPLKGNQKAIYSLAFSPDNNTIASSSSEGVIKLWDIKTGKEIKTFQEYNFSIVKIVFSPDGRFLASGSDADRTFTIWEVLTGKPLQKINSLGEPLSVAFSPDSKLLVGLDWNGGLRFWDAALGNEMPSKDISPNWLFLDNFILASVCVIQMNNTPILVNTDGKTVRFLNLTSNKTIVTLTLLSENEWLASTPEGFFDGTPNAWKQLIWRFNNNTFDYGAVELYFNDFFYPNLLQDVLAGKSPQPKAGNELEKIDRRQPKIEIVSVGGQSREQLGSTQAVNQGRTARVLVEVADNVSERKRAQHNPSSGAQDLRVLRNGSLVKVWQGDVFKLGKAGGCEQIPTKANEARRVRCAVEVPVVAGENNFSAYAFNLQNVKSEDDAVSVKGAENLKRDGTLYVLAIGVNRYANADYNLKYAVPDVIDIGAKIKEEQAKFQNNPSLKQYAKTEIITLKDETATKDNILLALKLFAEKADLPAKVCANLAENLCGELKVELAKIAPVQPEDALLIYYAGHGTSKEQRFFLLPHNFTDANLLEKQAVSDIELNKYLEKVDAGKLLMVIDACQSGQALGEKSEGRAPMNSKGLAQLAYDKGMLILTAAQSYQAALEAPRIGDKKVEHGLLTYALLEAFSNKEADKDGNRQIWEREWFDFAVSQVPLLQREAMRQREIDLKNKTADVTGRSGIYYVGGDKNQNADGRSVQTPRVFYRREPEIKPFILANP